MSEEIHTLPRRDEPSRTERLAKFFKGHPLIWIDGRQLEIAGKYAWRTRVSDLRRSPYFMTIENRQRRVTHPHPDGTRYVISEYRYVPEATRRPTEEERQGTCQRALPLL